MTNIRISEELTKLIKVLKQQHAKNTGNFISYEQIIEDALEDYDIDEYQDDDDNE
jgi:hypothetical protein